MRLMYMTPYTLLEWTEVLSQILLCIPFIDLILLTIILALFCHVHSRMNWQREYHLSTFFFIFSL